MKKTFAFFLLLIIYLAALLPQETQTTIQRPKVGLVLSGGGAKGLAHIGVLKVLEEIGMPIDYIGGTSMGSIVGGLYAIGYSADTLKELVAKQNWVTLLGDRFERKYLSFEEKENDGKIYIPLPLEEGKIQLPSGLIPGQNLSLLLNQLTWNAHFITDFTKYPIPFYCIASDLQTGKAIVMEKGNLHDAIRASMAIPSIFTPLEIDGHTMVDGGIFNNFPVDVMKEKGVDIIIGVDVGFELFDAKNLNSLTRIMEQTVFIHTIEEMNKRKLDCNIFIKPDLQNYSASSFDNADSIVVIGEYAARKQYLKLKTLADSINYISNNYKHRELTKANDSIAISSIDIVGNRHYSEQMILSKLRIKAPSIITQQSLNEGIKRIYGTMLFQRVNYHFENVNQSNNLIISVSERPQNLFTLGINYNTDFKASLFLNTAFYNVLLKGSKITLDVMLGENPRVSSTYFFNNLWNPWGNQNASDTWFWDFGIKTNINNYSLYDYLNQKRIASYKYTDFNQSIFAQTIFMNSSSLEIGLQNEFQNLKGDINPFNYPNTTNRYLNLYSILKFDTYDKAYYPDKGIQSFIEIKRLTKAYSETTAPATILFGKFSSASPFTRKLKAIFGINAGIIDGDSITRAYMFHVGGLGSNFLRNAFPFLGFNFVEIQTRNLLIIRYDLQYQFYKHNYFILKSNIGRTSNNKNDLISRTQKIDLGYGISYGYSSPIGPIEITFMQSPKRSIITYFNIGFWL